MPRSTPAGGVQSAFGSIVGAAAGALEAGALEAGAVEAGAVEAEPVGAQAARTAAAVVRPVTFMN